MQSATFGVLFVDHGLNWSAGDLLRRKLLTRRLDSLANVASKGEPNATTFTNADAALVSSCVLKCRTSRHNSLANGSMRQR